MRWTVEYDLSLLYLISSYVWVNDPQVSGNASMQNSFKDAGGIEPLITFMGWRGSATPRTPSSLLSAPNSSLDAASPAPKSAERIDLEFEFEMQLLSVQLILELCANDAFYTDYIHLAGGFDKVLQVLLWVS